jgi:hypothetical protein
MHTHTASALDRWLSRPLVADVLRHRAAHVAGHKVTPSRRWPQYLEADRYAYGVGERYAGHPISREMLGTAGQDAIAAPLDVRGDLLLRAFVMCQMWGGGGSGRVMANTRTALADPARTRQVLGEFAEEVATDPTAAAAGGLRGWSWAFSTKLGYALTYDRVTASGGRPALIYDSFVVNSLKLLGAEDHGGYRGYLEAVWSIASRHQVRPDAVEHLLFSPWLDLRTSDNPRLE